MSKAACYVRVTEGEDTPRMYLEPSRGGLGSGTELKGKWGKASVPLALYPDPLTCEQGASCFCSHNCKQLCCHAFLDTIDCVLSNCEPNYIISPWSSFSFLSGRSHERNNQYTGHASFPPSTLPSFPPSFYFSLPSLPPLFLSESLRARQTPWKVDREEEGVLR